MKKVISITLSLISTFIIFWIVAIDVLEYKLALYPMLYSLIPIIFYTIFTYDKERMIYDKWLIFSSILFGSVYAIGKEYCVNDLFLLNLSIQNICILAIQACIIGTIFYILATRFLTKKETKNNNHTKMIDILQEQNLGKLMLIILTCWIPYMVLMYPCFIQADTAFELAQALGMSNQCTNDVILINPHQMITQHHSILYTYLIKFFAEIDVNWGLYTLNFLQTIFVIFAIAKLFIFLSERLQDLKVLSYTFMVICTFPFFPYIFTILEKDTLFCAFFILFGIELYKLLNHEKYNIVILIITACFLEILRNNFKYAILPFMIVLLIKDKKKNIFIMLVALLLTSFGYSSFCKMMDIMPGSKAEAYAVPILQISKCVIEYNDELTKEEIETIDKVLEYDRIEELFNAKNVDDLKASYARRKPTDDEVKDFFKLWIKLGKQHPITYMESFLNKTMGYFYQFDPSMIVQRRSYSLRNDITTMDYSNGWKIKCSDFGFKPNDTIIKISNSLDGVMHWLYNLPIIGLLTVSPTYVWIMFFVLIMLIKHKDYNNMMYIFFLILYLGTILLSPVDGLFEFRYLYPIFASSPIFYLMYKGDFVNEKNN